MRLDCLFCCCRPKRTAPVLIVKTTPVVHKGNGWIAHAKPSKGDNYTLTDQRLKQLGASFDLAKQLVDETIRWLDRIRTTCDDETIMNLEKKSDSSVSGGYTPVGLLAQHFGLIDRSDNVKLDLGPALVWNVVRTVREVFGKVQAGWADEVTFAGLEGEAGSTHGLVRTAEDEPEFPEKKIVKEELKARQQKDKSFQPPKDIPVPAKYIPDLEDDDIFLRESMRKRIHLGYVLLDNPTEWKPHLTIIHEATHKFARTRDVDYPNSYTQTAMALMHWSHAVRNAEHYPSLCVKLLNENEVNV